MQDLVQDLARKLLARFVCFLQDRFYWVLHKILSVKCSDQVVSPMCYRCHTSIILSYNDFVVEMFYCIYNALVLVVILVIHHFNC